MDGAKRKQRGQPVSQGSSSVAMIDFGATPPWAFPLSIHEESALRSTQQSSSFLDSTTAHQHLESLRISNHPRLHRAASATEGSKVPVEPVHATTSDKHNDGSATEGRVDVDDDGVYMLNAHEQSWSGSLSEDEDVGEQMVLNMHLELALEKIKAKRLAECNAHMAALLYSDKTGNAATGHQGLSLIGKVKSGIGKELQLGARLIIDRMGNVKPPVVCANPLCPAPGMLVTPGSHYTSLLRPDFTVGSDHFCLPCLEFLWNNGDQIEQSTRLGSRSGEPEVSKKGLSMTLDGAMIEANPQRSNPKSAFAGTSPTPIASTSSVAVLTMPNSMISTPLIRSSKSSSPDYQNSVERSPQISSAGSPLPPKSQLRITISKRRNSGAEPEKSCEASKATAWQSAKAKASQDRQEPVRRSARLESMSLAVSQSPSVKPLKALASKLQRDITTPRSSKVPSLDRFVSEIRRDEERLVRRYRQRSQLMVQLQPEERREIEDTKRSPDAAARCVSMDAFGVICTDLLADDITYSTQCSNVSEQSKAPRRGDAYPQHGSKNAPKPVEHSSESKHAVRWCRCYSPEGDREIIQCKNDKCLIGRYHVKCINSDIQTDGHWLCPMCVANESEYLQRPLSLTDAGPVRACLAPTYTHRTAYSIATPMCADSVHTKSVNITRHVGALELDGSVDPSYHLQSSVALDQQGRERPSSQSTPASRSTELTARSPNGAARRSTTPPLDSLPETPGAPPSEADSTTSTGNWRRPPTRFQFLAEYIVAGASLNASEKARLEVWKAVSEEQVRWLAFREKYARTVETLWRDRSGGDGVTVLSDGAKCRHTDAQAYKEATQSSDGTAKQRVSCSTNGGISQEDEGEEDNYAVVLQRTAGLSRADCPGRNLSTVLID